MSGQRQILLLTGRQWVWTITALVVVSAATYRMCRGVSAWSSFAAGAMTAVIMHMAYSGGAITPLPHIAVLICALQYAIAPWAAQYCFHPQDSHYVIREPHRYFAYAGPAMLSILLGWTLSCVGLHLTAKGSPPQRVSPQLHRALDLMFWGGIGLKAVLGSGALGGLGFLFLLLANLRFIGVMGLMVLRVPGWRWRAAVVLILEISGAAGSGMFHEFVLWSLGLFAVYVFTRRPSFPLLLVWLALMAAGVFLLNDAKWQLREAVWAGSNQVTIFGKEYEMTPWNRPLVGGLCLLQSATRVFTGGYSEASVGDMVMRFNQGWIIDRVLENVPDSQPFAHGATVISAFEASLLPRVFAPNKATAGGRMLMERYADYAPFEDTSMDLGFAGEMYANFGHWGGIAGCGVYALILGLLFRWVAVRAQTSPLWWAIAAYVGHWALKAETDIGTVLNYLVKAALVVFAVVLLLPDLRAELTGRVEPTGQPPRRDLQPRVKPGGGQLMRRPPTTG